MAESGAFKDRWLLRLNPYEVIEGLLIVLLTIFSLPTTLAVSTERLVTNTNDSGPGSLRQAIIDSDLCNTGDTIMFESSVTGNTTLTTVLLEIQLAVSIISPGACLLLVSGGGADRVFAVDSGTTVTISGLTIEGAVGGARLQNNGTRTLNNVTVSGNVGGSFGDGIVNLSSGMLTLANSTVSGNFYSSEGGGIYNEGVLALTNSTVFGNFLTEGGWGPTSITNLVQ